MCVQPHRHVSVGARMYVYMCVCLTEEKVGLRRGGGEGGRLGWRVEGGVGRVEERRSTVCFPTLLHCSQTQTAVS